MSFIEGVNAEFEVTKELASMNDCNEIIIGEDIFKKLRKQKLSTT